MTGLVLILIILTLSLFILTRETYVKIVKDDVWEIGIHFPLSALIFKQSESVAGKKSKKEKQKKPAAYYFNLIRQLLKLSEVSEVHISRLSLPADAPQIYYGSALRSWGYHTAISAGLAYLRTRSELLTVDDNAIILNPDAKRLDVDITFKVRLFYLIRVILHLRQDDARTKRKRIRNVGK